MYLLLLALVRLLKDVGLHDLRLRYLRVAEV